jgi:hypothetical protein
MYSINEEASIAPQVGRNGLFQCRRRAGQAAGGSYQPPQFVSAVRPRSTPVTLLQLYRYPVWPEPLPQQPTTVTRQSSAELGDVTSLQEELQEQKEVQEQEKEQEQVVQEAEEGVHKAAAELNW